MAAHLLQAGVDINSIKAWLGHASINMTNIYAEKGPQTHWRDDKDLMTFLENL